MEPELIKMNPKGQLNVPEEIREKEGFNPGDKFVLFPVKDGILFKKVKLSNTKKKFEKIAKEVENRFKKSNVTKSDVEEAIQWARRKSS